MTNLLSVAPATPEVTEDQIWDAYNLLLMGPDVDRIRKMLIRYDLLRMVLDVPGDVVECGVFKGAGLLYFLKLLSIYAPGSARRVVGFDTFTSFAPANPQTEAQAVASYVAEAGFKGTSVEALRRRIEDAGLDLDGCDLVDGDITTSAAEYVAARPGFRISLLHMDLDLGAPTYTALEALWPRVVPGGIAVFDEYAIPRWTESEGVDRFLLGKNLRLRTIPNARTPTAYVVKP